MEGPALLATVDLVVGRVDVEHESGWPLLLPGVDERLEQNGLQCVHIVLDPVVASRRPRGRRMFQTVEGALAGQRRAVLAAAFELAGQQRQQWIVAQLVVVVEILVSQGNAHDALGHQRADRVLCQAGIAVIGEACSHPVDEPDPAVEIPEQQRSGVRRHRSAVERGGHPAPLAPLKYEGMRLTLCRHRHLPVWIPLKLLV